MFLQLNDSFIRSKFSLAEGCKKRREERRLLHLHFLFEAAPTVPANIGFLTSESLALSGVGDVPEGPLSLSLSLEALSHFLAHFSLLGLESC